MNKLAFHHICIQSSTYKESLAFYTDILGFELIKEDPYIAKRAIKAWLKWDSFYIELSTPKCSKPFTDYNYLSHGVTHLAFQVEDATLAYDEVIAKGYDHFKSKHGQSIYSIKGGHQFKLIAPEGTEIEIRDSSML